MATGSVEVRGARNDATSEIDGEVVHLYTDGSSHVANTGISGTPYTQTELALDTTQELLTFDPPIKACTIQVTSGTAGELTFDDVALFCFDAPNAATATEWLTEANQAPRVAIKPADGRVSIYFNGATVTDIYMVGKGAAVDLDVTIEGIV